MIRPALIRILTALDSLLSAAWSLVNPTQDEVFGRVDTVVENHWDQDVGLDDDAPTPDVVAAVVSETRVVDPDLTDDEKLECCRVAEFAWRMQTVQQLWAANGCEDVAVDGNTVAMGFDGEGGCS